MEKILHFRQLEAWQESHKLVLMVYQVMKGFPSTELMSQSETVGRLLNGLVASMEKRR